MRHGPGRMPKNALTRAVFTWSLAAYSRPPARTRSCLAGVVRKRLPPRAASAVLDRASNDC